MDTDWFLDFLAVCHTGNFTRAAETRNVSQPAFSRRIQALEAWVGVPLLERGTHTISTTAAGELLKLRAQQFVTELNKTQSLCIGAAQRDMSTVRLLSTHTLSYSFLPDWIKLVTHDLNPQPTVSITVATWAECVRQFDEGIANFLVYHHHSQFDFLSSLATARFLDVGTDSLILVAHPDRAAQGLTGPIPLIAYGQDSAFHAVTHAETEKLPFDTFEVLLTTMTQTILSNLRQNIGVGWCLKSLIDDEMRAGELVQVSEQSIPLSIRIARPKGRQSQCAEAMWSATVRNRRQPAPSAI